MMSSDLNSLTSNLSDNWNRDFDWPLNWNDLIEIEQKVKEILNKRIKVHNNFYKIILIDYKIFIEYSNFIYALLIIDKQPNLCFSEQNTYFYDIKKKGIPSFPIIVFPNLNVSSGFLRKKYRILKRLLLDNKFNLLNPFLNRVYFFKESRSLHAIDFLKKEKKSIITPISFFDVYNKKNVVAISPEEKGEILEVTNLIVEDLKNLVIEFGLNFTQNQVSYLKRVTVDVFSKSLQTLKAVELGLKGKKMSLYIAANNSFLSRIMSVAVRNNQGEIYGFSHGEPIIYNWDKISWMELSLNDTYYEYTQRLTDELKIVHSTNFQYRNKVKIKSFDSDVFKKFYKTNSNNLSNTPPKKIMLIGNAYRETGMSSVTSPSGLMQLQIETEIIYKLKELGYVVLYKKHPGGYFASKELPFSRDVEIIDTPFETSHQIADKLLFYYTRTTTFGYALSLNKGVVIIDSGIESIPEKLLTSLKKQCSYLKARYNEKNKFNVDKEQLKKAVEREHVNNSYYKEFLLN